MDTNKKAELATDFTDYTEKFKHERTQINTATEGTDAVPSAVEGELREKIATNLSGVASYGEDGLTRTDTNEKSHRGNTRLGVDASRSRREFNTMLTTDYTDYADF